ncbi:MAG: hypothetical protein ABIO92_08070 [Chloroflexia bacterium]
MQKLQQTAMLVYWALTSFAILIGLTACSNTELWPSSSATETSIATSSSTKEVVRSFPTPMPPEAEDVPLYPGAFSIDNSRVYEQDWRRTRYQVESNSHEVVAFYKKQLPNQGWVLDREYWSGFRASLSYKWDGSTSAVPWDSELHLDIDQSNVHVYVNMSLERVPNLDRIPLYQDAQQVEVKEVPSKEWGSRFIEQHTSYITDVKPEEVKAFYKAMLQPYGWSSSDGGSEDGDNNDNIYKGIKFGWRTGDIHHMRYIGLDITANEVPGGRTNVKMKLDGTLLP